jgi:hypothetical protein
MPVELTAGGASDDEILARTAAFLTEHPWAPTRAVYEGVKGDKQRIRASSMATDSTASTGLAGRFSGT